MSTGKDLLQTKWDLRFLLLAKHVAGWSKDPSTKTGAVITDGDNRIVSTGYNGLPRGIEDTAERLGNRNLKYKLIVHCERNAILFAQRSLRGCTLYTWPFMSCSVCAAELIQVGISRHVAPVCWDKEKLERWGPDFALTEEMLKEAGVRLDLYNSFILRDDRENKE